MVERRPNRTRMAVLGALSLGPASGIELREDLRRTVAHFWHESEGQLYPVLRQLLEDGSVTMTTEPSRGQRGRPRRVYHVTAHGLAELDAWLAAPLQPAPPPRNELLLKVYFGSRVHPSVTAGHLEAYRHELQVRYATYEAIGVELDAEESPRAPDWPYWVATLAYGRAITEAGLAWCDATLARLEATSPDHVDGSAVPGGEDHP